MQKSTTTPTCWSDIKTTIKKLNHEFYKQLEAVSPGDDLPLFLVKLPYGNVIADAKGSYLPKELGKTLTAKLPLTMVLDKQVEAFFDTPHDHKPWKIYSPGDFFSAPEKTKPSSKTSLIPNKNTLTITAGIRDIMLLSLHSTTNDFYALRRKYAIPTEMLPSDPSNHFAICKHIVEKEDIKWEATLLVFGDEWQTQIDNNPDWWPFRQYLLEDRLRRSQTYQSALFLEQAIYDIARTLDLKLRPHLHDTIKQLFMMASHQTPGFRPATTDEGFPLKEICGALKSASREFLSFPIFMQSAIMTEKTRKQFIYQSISYNSQAKYEPKTSPNSYLNELMQHITDYLQHFSSHALTQNTVFESLHNKLEIVPCSTRGSKQNNIKKCLEMYELDPAFWYPRDTLKYSARYGAPINSQFCKAFVGIRWK